MTDTTPTPPPSDVIDVLVEAIADEWWFTDHPLSRTELRQTIDRTLTEAGYAIVKVEDDYDAR
jgi:hypothetical protein